MKVGSEMGSLNDILYPTVETVDFFTDQGICTQGKFAF